MAAEDKPSEYAARNCFYGASFPSKAELDGIEEIGEDRVLWGNDYPHYEGTFPYNLESLRLTFADVPEARRRKVLARTPRRSTNSIWKSCGPWPRSTGQRPSR